MRLWSIHPKYLDQKGLSGLWREALLAKAVLQGKTKGWKKHPQLERFKNKPISYINTYLLYIWKEAKRRNYHFDKRKIENKLTKNKIKIKKGQLIHEFSHIRSRLRKRAPKKYKEIKNTKNIKPHPIFKVIKGGRESWEKS